MRKIFILISFFITISFYSQDNLKEISSVNSYTWSPFTGSRNIHGVINSSSKPLQYNPALNVISFFHNASASYSPYPSTTLTAIGAVVAMISTDFGLNWDSACVWSDSALTAVNPQGAIYNIVGNTNPSNAYLVGCGPVVTGTNYVGNWYASKRLLASNFNYSASPTPSAMQYMQNALPFGSLGKHDLSWSSFSSTDDGKVRSIGILANDINATNNSGLGLRGALIATGNFWGGVFNWTVDSLIPATTIRSNGTKQLYYKPIMAWSQDGAIGYAIFIGSRSGSSQSNMGWQPIIYKTTNYGVSWVLIPGLDFNANTTANNIVKGRLATITTSTALAIPFFNFNEGIDATVDLYGKLHIATTIASTKSDHPDSLEYLSRFSNGGESYVWAHTPCNVPYLYDFIGDGTSWSYALIDSLTTEAPGSKIGEPGYNYNPWNADPLNNNNKVTSSARIQLSRTPDSKFIMYTWAESDTNFTTNNAKWNEIPNVRARCLNVNAGYGLSYSEIKVTNSIPINSNVSSKAMFHFSSPITRTESIAINTINISLPITVSNNSPYSQSNPVTHWYASAILGFDTFFPWSNPILSIKQENAIDNLNNHLNIYPNPTTGILNLDLENFPSPENHFVKITTLLGQIVLESKLEKTLNISDLKTGIYFLQLFDKERLIATEKIIKD